MRGAGDRLRTTGNDRPEREEAAIAGKMLKNVYYKLEKNHQAGLQELLEELEAEGIGWKAADGRKRSGDVQAEDMERRPEGTECVCDLLITDDCRLAEQAGAEEIACIGISESNRYFAGASMVLPDLLDVDVQMLRECFCHFHGIPATIAKSSRLILRELAEEDVEVLCRIGEEPGMEYAFCGSRKKAGFTPEVLKAYCKEQYRLYGYGLWGVFLKENVCSQEVDQEKQDDQEQARLIGCCGFAEASEISARLRQNMMNEPRGMSGLAEEYADGLRMDKEVSDQCAVRASEQTKQESGHGLQLELEYMLSSPYRHQGIGNEMCRMALQYAREYLRVDTVWVQVHEKNVAGYALARKLGFRSVDDRRKCPGARESRIASEAEARTRWFAWRA